MVTDVDSPPPSQGARFARSSRRRRRTARAWLFLTPTLVVVACVALYPLVQTLYLSFTDARLGSDAPAELVGVHNYVELAHDVYFRRAFVLTVLFTLVTVLAELVLGLIAALAVNSRFRGKSAVRAVMLIPWAVPTVVCSQMWKWMFNDVYGVAGDLLVRLGVLRAGAAILAERSTSFWAVSLVDVWKTTPFMALLLLAGLQLIPREVHDAARIDGATRLQRFIRITLPLLKPALFVALIFRTLDALRVFDVFFVMFGGRPDMQTMATYAQQTLVSIADIGYGSAISVALFVVIAIFIALYVAVFRAREV